MKNHRFLWLRNRTTDNRKCEKARNIKEKRTIEMFSTVSKKQEERRSSQRDNPFCNPERLTAIQSQFITPQEIILGSFLCPPQNNRKRFRNSLCGNDFWFIEDFVRSDLDAIERLQSEFSQIELLSSTPEAYFKQLKIDDKILPHHCGDLNPWRLAAIRTRNWEKRYGIY